MDQVAYAALVGSVGDGFYEGRSGQTADTAEALRVGTEGILGPLKGVAAAGARGSRLDGYFRPAGSTNWNGRKAREGGTADGTGSREDGATHSIHRTSKHAGHGAPSGNLR